MPKHISKHNYNEPFKIILISSLVGANILIWYDIFGVKFLLVIAMAGLIIVLTSKTKNA